jgi:hypothetical protein
MSTEEVLLETKKEDINFINSNSTINKTEFKQSLNQQQLQNQLPSESIKLFSQSNEEAVIWDLEVWKRAEQTKFKAYLKQLEYEFLSNISEDFQKKDEEREKEFKAKINELNVLQTRLRKKATELESRENKLNFMEEELKMKMNEVARQLANKEEEIVYYNKRFKESKMLLEKDKQNLLKQLEEKEKDIQKIETQFKNFKKEIDESPLTLIKNELNRKTLELEESNREKDRIIGEKEKYRQQSERLKIDLIKIKKVFEGEKEQIYKQKLEDFEKLKFEIYNQKISHNEMNELQELRIKLKQLTEEKKESPKREIEDNLKKKEYRIINIEKKNNTYTNQNRFENFDLNSELHRLNIERSNLLISGMYQENDALIIQIDNRIRKLIEMQNN